MKRNDQRSGLVLINVGGYKNGIGNSLPGAREYIAAMLNSGIIDMLLIISLLTIGEGKSAKAEYGGCQC
jgi:hypothetical protein